MANKHFLNNTYHILTEDDVGYMLGKPQSTEESATKEFLENPGKFMDDVETQEGEIYLIKIVKVFKRTGFKEV